MRDYIYPKVPSHYHETVTDEFLTNTDVTIVEKLDGSNCKLTAYDKRYDTLYGEDVHEHNPEHGDIIVSTKKTVQGTLSDDISQFDGAFHRLITHLRETLSQNNLLELHDKYDSPLVLYGEHMLRATLDYDYETNPPPAFIGFDVLVMNDFGDQPSNPLQQRFTGFLPLSEAYDVLSQLTLHTARIIDKLNTSDITQSEKELDITIPESEYANTKAEGVVLRSDEKNRRVKYVSEEFRERSTKSWSALEKNCNTGAEMFCAKFITNPRIQKCIMKAVNDPDTTNITPNQIVDMVVMDVWNEDLPSIMTMQTPINPQDIYDITYTRCETVLDTFRTNAELNNTSIDNIWADFVNTTEINQTVDITDTNENMINRIVTSNQPTETALINEFADETKIIGTAVKTSNTENKPFGNWVIPTVNDTLQESIWHENLDVLANLPTAFNPETLSNELMNTVTDTITTYTTLNPVYRNAKLTAHYIKYKTKSNEL